MKFGDILCEPPPRPDTASTLARGWPQLSPRYSPPDSSPDRRLRSRSSPKRIGVEEEWMNAQRMRSPSASPTRSRVHGVQASLERSTPPLAPPPPLAHPHVHHHDQPRHCSLYYRAVGCGGGTTVTARAGFARLSAYYSARPPAVPLKLVPVAQQVPAPLMPSLLPTHSCTSSPPLPTCDPVPVTTNLDDVTINEKCKLAVRSVLGELMAALPLSAPSSPPRTRRTRPVRPAPPPPASTMSHARSASPTMANFHASANSRGRSPLRMATVAPSESGVAWSAASSSSGSGSADSEPGVCPRRLRPRRHVATQAQFTGSTRNDDGLQGACTFSTSGAERRGGCEEWLGGVRALRDSHVRLVLRQLRHIERLNRALDRATRPAQPPAPHSATVPSLITSEPSVSPHDHCSSPPANYARVH